MMGRGRIIGVILALCALVSLAPAASAHPGATVFSIAIGVVTPIEVLVPADYGKPIDQVTIAAAPGFRLDGGTAPDGWSVTRSDAGLTFTGGVIPANSPGLIYRITGEASIRGEMIFPVTTRSPDGTLMRYRGGPGAKDAGIVVYAGVAPRLLNRGTRPWRAIAGGVVVTVGAIGSGIIWWRRRGVRRPTLTPR